MFKRVKDWLASREAKAKERSLARLKAIEAEHYREFLECNEVARDLARLAETACKSEGEASRYREQSQEEYEAADFHYAAYIEARERYREATRV